MFAERPAILIVDDRPEQRLSLGAVLQDLAEEVVGAASGREALRLLLQREFAVILLDVNMPDVDGFETASLIRQRKTSRATPIIFVTAYADDAWVAQGYSLGAVDFIVSPVDPAVLRTKVSVFLELYRKRAEVSRQAESLRSHAAQLRRLAEAATAIHGASSLEDLLKIVGDTAASILGASQVAVEIDARRLPDAPRIPGSRSRAALWRPERTHLPALARGVLEDMDAKPLRFGRAAFEAASRSWGLAAPSEAYEPLRGWLAAPLSGRDGARLGWIQLSDKRDGDFTAEDEVVLIQLAQMTSIAAESTLFAHVREANRLKDQFLATLSHELRTPLQSILTWSQLLGAEAPEGSMLRRGLEVIDRNARAQTRLIEDLLDVSRIISGKLLVERQPLRLGEVVEAAAEDAQPAARDKRVEIVLDPADDPWVLGDLVRLRQVLGNLLANAIKFTPEGGRVTMAVGSGEHHAEVVVRDDGKGIAPEFLPHLFERFRQADSGTTRAHGGLGIGLAIARHLVELQGGSIAAESEGEGRGATFRVRLPLASTVRAGASPHRRGDAATDLAGVRVLLVEDDADTRECLALALGRWGARVEAVASAREALQALDRAMPQVLLSDLAMPEEDGLSLIRRVRARPPERGGRVPAGALSAYVRPEERARAILAGYDLHVPKPVEPGALADAVRQLLDRPDV